MVSFWRNNYRVIIYLLTFLSVWVGLVMTAKLRINASAATRGLYDALEWLRGQFPPEEETGQEGSRTGSRGGGAG